MCLALDLLHGNGGMPYSLSLHLYEIFFSRSWTVYIVLHWFDLFVGSMQIIAIVCIFPMVIDSLDIVLSREKSFIWNEKNDAGLYRICVHFVLQLTLIWRMRILSNSTNEYFFLKRNFLLCFDAQHTGYVVTTQTCWARWLGVLVSKLHREDPKVSAICVPVLCLCVYVWVLLCLTYKLQPYSSMRF